MSPQSHGLRPRLPRPPPSAVHSSCLSCPGPVGPKHVLSSPAAALQGGACRAAGATLKPRRPAASAEADVRSGSWGSTRRLRWRLHAALEIIRRMTSESMQTILVEKRGEPSTPLSYFYCRRLTARRRRHKLPSLFLPTQSCLSRPATTSRETRCFRPQCPCVVRPLPASGQAQIASASASSPPAAQRPLIRYAMCKTYTWSCRACRALQDITYRCSASHPTPCPCRTFVAGLPPDALYRPVTCCYCAHTALPAEASCPPTCNDQCSTSSSCVTSAFAAPSQQQHPDARGWDPPATFHHQGPQTTHAVALPQRQTYPHVTPPLPPIDPALLALDSTPGSSAETPAHKQHQLHHHHHHRQRLQNNPECGECHHQQHQQQSIKAATTFSVPATPAALPHPPSTQHAPPPVTSSAQQPSYHLPPLSQSSPLRPAALLIAAVSNQALAEMDRRRTELFDQAAQLQRESRASGQREESPRAEHLDRAWATLCMSMTGDAGCRDDAAAQQKGRQRQHGDEGQRGGWAG
ncbi:hypothetical protein B0J12DRAFT_423455 [Macrophomina phaseolina]|uniref:Uncharacterized protein n=1 Tax=Macrophomina phaseolina TaxID=35725 RepID=A0ABQ8GGI5_9PEZI|nr:hypothetical protein B0J12DRAFT_423455 [Macrophomina phaseolina]